MQSTKKNMFIIYFLFIVIIPCFIYAYFIEPYWIEVNTVDIFTDKLKQTSLRIAHITDLHCDTKVRNEKKLVEIINPLTPDVIVFTGDAVNTLRALPIFKDTLRGLRAGIGKYGTTGNIEEWFWPDADLFGDTGFRRLENESLEIEKDGEKFFISGINYEDLDGYRRVLGNVPHDRYSILLHHSPDLIEDLTDVNVDLYLAGHTHGGQFALPFYGALITFSRYGKRYEAGKYIVGDTILYVNRGVGMMGGVMPRIRFFARPQVVIFNIRPSRSSE